jgi:glutamine synthetase
MPRALSEIAKERGIKNFMISYTDLFGGMRAKLVPAVAIDKMSKEGAGFAGFATWLDMTPAMPDLFAMADPDSLVQLPWKKEVGWLTSDLYMEGKPVAQGPRNLLKRLIGEAAELDYEMRSGVECEFFLLTADGKAIADSADSQTKSCYDQQALMRRYEVIAEISDAMIELGWNPYQSDHEDANGQFEMNWGYDEALKTADRHAFFKYMAKSIAEKHGMRATFMPKPFPNLTGSGCHSHVSLWRRGENMFHDPKGELGVSELGYRFLSGLLEHADAICALTNPVVNSYKRLSAPRTTSGATWAPNSITYTGNNRTHMIRIPEGGRLEFRLADGAANPYLLQSAILVAGLEGVKSNRSPGSRCDFDMYSEPHKADGAKRLPQNLLDAVRLFESSPFLKEGFGEEFVNSYAKLKHQEWQSYTRHLTDWERENTLDC